MLLLLRLLVNCFYMAIKSLDKLIQTILKINSIVKKPIY